VLVSFLLSVEGRNLSFCTSWAFGLSFACLLLWASATLWASCVCFVLHYYYAFLLTIWWPAGWLDAGRGVARLLAASDSSKCEWERKTESPWVSEWEKLWASVVVVVAAVVAFVCGFQASKATGAAVNKSWFLFLGLRRSLEIAGGLVDWRLVVAEV
jgi:hypothetical protein